MDLPIYRKLTTSTSLRLQLLAITSVTIRWHVSRCNVDHLYGTLDHQQISACDEYLEELGPSIHGRSRIPVFISSQNSNDMSVSTARALASLATTGDHPWNPIDSGTAQVHVMQRPLPAGGQGKSGETSRITTRHSREPHSHRPPHNISYLQYRY